MLRKLILVGIVTAALAACGGSSASPSPSDTGMASAAPSDASSSVAPGASEAASAAPTASDGAVAGTSTAICDGISLRKQPSSSAARVGGINSGAAVHVVATVSGSAYTAGSCGTSGDTWLKIDKVAGKSVKSAYGVSFVYAAAGFFQ